MDKQWAKAWQDIENYAASHQVTQVGVELKANLIRDGHNFNYVFTKGDATVYVWAEKDSPAYGLRVKFPVREYGTSCRCWNIDALDDLVTGLIAMYENEIR